MSQPIDIEKKTAIVVGAGLGGLTAAWRLQQAGYSVEVLEREPQASGRVRSVRVGDATIDTGATVFLPAYRETLALIGEMGMTADLEPIRGYAAVAREGRMHPIDMDAPLQALFTRLIGWRSKLSLIKLIWRYLSVRKSLNFVSLGTASGQDSQTLAAYCRDNFPAEVYDYLLNPALKFLYLHDGESGSLIELLWWMRANGIGKPRSLRGGTSSLTAALASRLSVRTRAEVTRVALQGSGVVVEIKDASGDLKSLAADVCVVTVPGTIAAGICEDGLDAAQREFLCSRRYDRSIVVSFCTRVRPPLDALMFMIPDGQDAELATVIFAHNIGPQRAPSGTGIVNAYFMKAWSDRHHTQSDEAVMEAAQARLLGWIPELGDLAGWNVQRWSHTAAITATGDCARIQAFEDAVDPTCPIQLIGDFQAQASMNVAVANANRVAQRLTRSPL